MELSSLTQKAHKYLETLCDQIPNRRVGSDGNQQATAFFAETVKTFGFQVECPEFECIDWQTQGSRLVVQGGAYSLQASPYSLGVQVTAPLVDACSGLDLEALDLQGKILLMRGELAKEQFLPKNFPFFQVDEQQRIVQLLEAEQPLAILTATTRNPEMAGGLYPFPVFEDGDFDIPSAYITEEEGNELATHEGREVSLEIKARRIPSRGCNVVARRGDPSAGRIVLFAHIDAKLGTPGALDNGTGIVTMLLLAESLKDYAGGKCIEIVALNGEDYYSNPGEQLYLKQNEGKFHQIALGINVDGLGYHKGKTAYSLYDCPQSVIGLVEEIFGTDESFSAGEPWFQGDHALFLMNGRPALALTSELVGELMSEIAHTDKDTPEIIDPEKVARASVALSRLVQTL